MQKKLKYSLDEIQERVNKKFPTEQLKVLNFDGVTAPIQIQCLKCGTIYNFKRLDNTLRNKKICRKCYVKPSNEYSATVTKFINYFNTHMKDKYEVVEWFQKYLSTEIIQLKCKKCGHIRNFHPDQIKETSFKCPKCEVHNVKLTQQEAEKKVKQATKGEILLIGNYESNNKSTKFKCQKCGFIFTTSVASIVDRQTRCPKCSISISKGEQKIINFLEKQDIKYSFQKKLEGTRMHFDFYLDDLNLAIEYDGIQHFKPIKHFDGEKGFIETQRRDQEKNNYCTQNKINLLRISYLDFDNIERIINTEVQRLICKNKCSEEPHIQ